MYMILVFLQKVLNLRLSGILVVAVGFLSKKQSFWHMESSGGPNLDGFTTIFGSWRLQLRGLLLRKKFKT